MTITVKNVPRHVHQTLKRQAKLNKRSLNQELNGYLEQKAGASDRQAAFAKAIRHRNEIEKNGIKVKMSKEMDPVSIIRKLRDTR